MAFTSHFSNFCPLLVRSLYFVLSVRCHLEVSGEHRILCLNFCLSFHILSHIAALHVGAPVYIYIICVWVYIFIYHMATQFVF